MISSLYSYISNHTIPNHVVELIRVDNCPV